MRIHSVITSPRRGFTLLEMMMVMFILTLLLGAVFGIVQGTVQLTDDMTLEQERDARQRGFTQFCERTFRNLPAQATVRMRVKRTGSRYLSQLVLKDAPIAFASNGAGATGLTILETEEAPDGYLRVVLKWLTPEEVNAWEQGDSSVGQQKLLLLENVAVCEFKFYNPQSREWEPVWNDKISLIQQVTDVDGSPASQDGPLGQRPSLVELRLGIGAEEVQRWVLWTPPGQPPTGSFGGPRTPAPAPPGSPPPPAPGGPGTPQVPNIRIPSN